MAKYQSRSFIPASILKYAAFLLLAVLFALLSSVPALADVMEVTTSQTGTQNWNSTDTMTRRKSCSTGIRFVQNDFYIRSPSTSNNETFGGYIYLGYDYDAENDVFTISETSGTLALKNSAASKTITVGNLYMAKGTVVAWGADKPTLAGAIYVESSEATINSQDAAYFYIASSIVKNTPDAVLNLTPYEKNGSVGEIYIRNSSNVNCPLNLTRGKIFVDGTNTFGSDFALTVQDNTGIVLGSNLLGVEGTTITLNGTTRYVHAENTAANKTCYSNILVPTGSVLNAQNNYGVGAIGSMTFVGELQGAGTLNVETVGSTNTNSLTLGHSQNSFTGTVNVKTGKLQFTVLGHDNVTYTGTNALINAASISVASGATIDVGATTQTFNNLSGAGTVTVSAGGRLTLNCTADTIFSGEISSTEEVIKTGNGTFRINEGTKINCPLNVNQGQFYVNGTDLSGSNFALTLQDGTSVLLSGNNLGIADSTITVNGTVTYNQAANTSANKVNFSNVLITAGSTLKAENSNGAGAKGSIVFAGDLQGAGTLNVDTVGTSNTNSLTLGHPENSFTGNVNVTRGKLQFTVVGYDNVTYTGTNALINASSVAVASGATIDVASTEQTFNNLSGAGSVTIANGGSAMLNNTTPTEFSGVISGAGSVTKTGDETLTLSGNNTFTGGTTVSDGTLTLTYINGTKGTLATGSTVTVDGSTSVLAGHGDILGYSSGSVGTVNLQNGGTLYNDSTGNHITVGAAINMNNGVITAVEDANGNGTFGNFVFDNAINVTGGEDNEISAKKITLRQYSGTSDEEVGGKITVAEGAKLTISSQIAAHTSPTVVPLVKLGAGELVLSGDNTYTTGTYVYGGTLTLEKVGEKGTLATGSAVTVDGATSVLAGHGDILGYGSKTVGTVNLQNGGTLYNDSTDAHVTVGAAVNMNHGFITVDENAAGTNYGNFVFDNAINVTGGTDNEISANLITLRQFGGTPGDAGGKISVVDGSKLTISSVIRAEGVPLVKSGAGELVLTETNTYGTGTTVSDGKITLKNSGTLGTGAVVNDALIEFAQDNDVKIPSAISGTGSVVKTGTGTVTMSGDSSYTGGTTVNAGTLTLTYFDGTKGTLATGSTVTVDGATSVLAGHGDVLGYSSGSVGTINLQNGGTLYNDSTGNHITVGAAINMNNGVITAVEDANGNGTFGNFVFDNAINVTGGEDNVISAKKITLRQYAGTSDEEVGGKITVADGAKLTVSSIIRAEGVPLVKSGEGELVLSGENTLTTGVFVNAGKLTLTKQGQKGTLAPGSAVTVDGETSILAGHGDILGFSGDTVGTVNLQNGGTLYNDATADQAAHITVGAVVNMNGGFITADPDAQGSDSFGNYIFDNAINVLGGTDNEISVNRITLRQYGGTPGNGGGKINVVKENEEDAVLTISSVIDGNYVPLVKQGAGELVLNAANTYSKGTTISEGTLTLAGAGTTGSGTVAIAADGTLNFYVTAEEDPKQVNVTSANAISGTGKIVKSGNGVLRFNNENADGSVKADSFAVNSGRLDYKGFFEGNIEIVGGTLSPGNSVGTLTVTGNVSVINGTALFEFDPYGSDSYDVLNILGENASFAAGDSMIQLYFENEADAKAWAENIDENGYRLVADDDFSDRDYSSWLYNYTNLFGLTGRGGDGLYLVAASPEPGSGVPEPSTWALLALGAAGLLFWRKRK